VCSDLKELKARGSGFGGLRAFSSQLPAFRRFIEANSASTEGWGEDGFENIVRDRWVIVCGWLGRGGGICRSKGVEGQCGSGFGGIESFQQSPSSI
jgi:hypothetical protein